MRGQKKTPKRSPEEARVLADGHLWLAMANARMMFRNSPLCDDLAQEAWFAIYRAAELYDPSEDAAFATYATKCVRGTLLREWYRLRCLGHIPIPTATAFRSIERRGASRTTSDVDDAVARLTSTTEKNNRKWDARAYYTFTLGERSLSETTGDASEPHPSTLEESIASDEPSPEDNASVAYAERSAQRIMEIASLTPREREVIESRFLRDEEETLLEVGDRLGVSRERIRQNEFVALRKLREAAKMIGYEGIVPLAKDP